MKLKKLLFACLLSLLPLSADQTIQDDTIIKNSACIGLDCVNGESFGFNTLILKENNLKIKFDDTSSTSTFPNEDWEIVINDAAVGGSEYFAVRNATTDTTLFNIANDGVISMGTSLENTFNLTTSGNLIISGTLTDASDKDLKENIVMVNGKDVLNKLLILPISTWNYKNDKDKQRHIGSMAQDFYKLFKFGPDNRHIAPKDVGFIAVVGVQELKKEMEVKDKKIVELESKLKDLEMKIEKITKALKK